MSALLADDTLDRLFRDGRTYNGFLDRPVSDETLALALKLAAFYSKGRGHAVPVNYTLRRYVKKPAGTPAGYVTFTGERAVQVSAEERELTPFAVDNKERP